MPSSHPFLVNSFMTSPKISELTEILIRVVEPPLDGSIMGSTISEAVSDKIYKAIDIPVHVLILEKNKQGHYIAKGYDWWP